MVSCFISRIVILIFGTLYPAYASYKAVRTKNVKEYVKWMMYWIVFALFTCAETFTDLFLSFWFPFYYEIKIITVIYLLSPATKGSSILYRKFVHPVLIKREQEIDEYIAKAKEQGYHTMLNLGSKGVTYATSLIMQTAIKGGGGLVNQLRKSYSLSDLSEEQHSRNQKIESRDVVDNRYDDPRVGRRISDKSPRRTISNPSQAGLYFPEVDIFQRPLSLDEESYYSKILSSEEISSGYSSGDPLYYDMQRPKGDHLVRTASLGGSNRIRTRAATKAGLPKRSSLAEGGSTWSSVEPRESQIEPDEFFCYPLTHSSSLPLYLTPFGNFVPPEFQHMLGNITQEQMFTIVNQSPYLPFFNSSFENISESVLNKLSENPSVVISEVKNVVGDSSVSQKLAVNPSGTNSDKKLSSQDQFIKVQGGKEKETMTTSNKTTGVSGESFLKAEDREKSYLERSGKYNKKPAPTPPMEDPMPQIESEDEDLEFCTPNASPKLERKIYPDTVSKTSNDNTIKALELLEVPKKNKSKEKKKDFQISKKLHFPKMNFPFWHQKTGKHSSGSESSSVVSVEIAGGKADKYCISLKGDDDQNFEQTEKDPNQSVKD